MCRGACSVVLQRCTAFLTAEFKLGLKGLRVRLLRNLKVFKGMNYLEEGA